LQELLEENAKLQVQVGLLEAQPQLLFAITETGDVNYITEKTLNFVKVNDKSANQDFSSIHVSNILSEESTGLVLSLVQQLGKCSTNAAAFAYITKVRFIHTFYFTVCY
jgi:hypothetical protein